jgi:hypothetical protein
MGGAATRSPTAEECRHHCHSRPPCTSRRPDPGANVHWPLHIGRAVLRAIRLLFVQASVDRISQTDYNFHRALVWTAVMTSLAHLDPAFSTVWAIEAVNEPEMDASQTPGYGDCEPPHFIHRASAYLRRCSPEELCAGHPSSRARSWYPRSARARRLCRARGKLYARVEERGKHKRLQRRGFLGITRRSADAPLGCGGAFARCGLLNPPWRPADFAVDQVSRLYLLPSVSS